MAVFRLDKDFFRFLDALDGNEDPWDIYKRFYLIPNRSFLSAYWKNFPWFNEDQIRNRVKSIRVEHYAHIRSLFEREPIESKTRDIFEACRRILPMNSMPDAYYFIGFFSNDAFALEVEGRWAVVIGCERFRELASLPILLAHEYGHCYWNSCMRKALREGLDPLLEKLLAEGFAVHLSVQVLPSVPLARHTFLSPSTFHWCIEHRQHLWSWLRGQIGSSQGVSRVFWSCKPEEWIPSRSGYLLAYQWVALLREVWGKEKDLRGFTRILQEISASTAKGLIDEVEIKS